MSCDHLNAVTVIFFDQPPQEVDMS